MKPVEIGWLLSSALIFMYPLHGRAGQEGHGGEAVLCYSDVEVRDKVYSDLVSSQNTNQETDLQLGLLSQRPMLLDLLEASVSAGFPKSGTVPILEKSSNTVLAQLLAEAGIFYGIFKDYISDPASWHAADHGVGEIRDATYQARFKKNCLVAQVAVYNDETNTVLYDSRITNRMDETNQGALKIHEDLFRMYRTEMKMRNRDIELLKRLSLNGNENLIEFADKLYGLRISGKVTSDTVRPLVGYLYTHSRLGLDFHRVADRVAVGIEITNLRDTGLHTYSRKYGVESGYENFLYAAGERRTEN